jgi:hypothetical protein
VSKPITLAAGALVFFVATACSDQTVSPDHRMSAGDASASANSIVSGGSDRMVSMMDACDHDSFAAQGIDCSRNGGVQFSDLIAQLLAHQSAGAWHNSPAQMDAKVGLTLLAVNKGGEVHTFTKVAHFGGSIVPELNPLLGNVPPAPECLAETNFVPPGGTNADDVVQPGTTLYQCCIHPWMRTVVNGRS